MGRREEKREATRQDILASAGILFMKKGYEDTSVDDIAAAANVAKGTFYYHFKSKDEVLLGLSIGYLKRLSEKVDRELEQGKPPLEILIDTMKATSRDTESYRELSKYFFMAMFTRMGDEIESQFRNEPASWHNIITKIIAEAQKRGEIDPNLDSAEIGVMIAGLSHHAQVTWIFLDEKRPLESKVEEWIKVVLRGLAP